MAGDDDTLVDELEDEDEREQDEKKAGGDAPAEDVEAEPDPDDDAAEEEDGDGTVALDVLEAEELEIVESDATETMLVDEASEIRAIRREEMTLDIEAGAPRPDEFVCQSCFLVLKMSQLANKRKRLCVDCA